MFILCEINQNQRVVLQMPDNLLRTNESNEAIGLNFQAVKNFIVRTTPFHLDLQPYVLAHFRAKSTYLEELAKQASNLELVTWTPEIVNALAYIEKLIDCILETDETTYACDLRDDHQYGFICPNRVNLSLPEPEE